MLCTALLGLLFPCPCFLGVPQCSYIPRLAHIGVTFRNISVGYRVLSRRQIAATRRVRIGNNVTERCTGFCNEMTFDPLEAVVQAGNVLLTGSIDWIKR